LTAIFASFFGSIFLVDVFFFEKNKTGVVRKSLFIVLYFIGVVSKLAFFFEFADIRPYGIFPEASFGLYLRRGC
jgi:hypothetical protein